MEETNKVLIQLLANELFNTDMVLVNQIDWDEIYKLAEKHSITSLIYRNVRKIPSCPSQFLDLFRSAAINASIWNEKLLDVQNKIIHLFFQECIPCAVIKGSSVAVHYPCAEMRGSGDIDLLVGNEQFTCACEEMIKIGFHHKSGNLFHEVFVRHGVIVELHNAVSSFPDNKKGKYAFAYTKDFIHKLKNEFLSGYYFPVLNPILQGITLLTHMERHMATSGVGLRQLCDWAVTINNYRGFYDDSALQVLEYCGLLRFAKVVTSVCSKYLGMPSLDWCNDISDTLTDALFDEFMSSGNMQNIDAERSVSTTFSLNKTDNNRTVLGNYIANTNNKAKKEFAIAAKYKLILPFFWFFYPLRWWLLYIRGERNKIKINKMFSIAKRRKKLYRALGLYK